MSSRSRVGIVLAGLLLGLGVMAPGAGAAKPALEKITVDEEFVDDGALGVLRLRDHGARRSAA